MILREAIKGREGKQKCLQKAEAMELVLVR